VEGCKLTSEMQEAALGAASVAARAAIAAVTVFDNKEVGNTVDTRSVEAVEKSKTDRGALNVFSLGDEDAARILRSLRASAQHTMLPELVEKDGCRATPHDSFNHHRDNDDGADFEQDIIADLQRHNDRLRWDFRSMLKDAEQMLSAALAGENGKARHLLDQLRLRASCSLVYTTKTVHKERDHENIKPPDAYFEKLVSMACRRAARLCCRRVLLAWRCDALMETKASVPSRAEMILSGRQSFSDVDAQIDMSSDDSSPDATPRDDNAGRHYPTTVFSSRSPQNKDVPVFRFPEPENSTSVSQTPLNTHPVHSLTADVSSAYSRLNPMETLRHAEIPGSPWTGNGLSSQSEGGSVPKLNLAAIEKTSDVLEKKIQRENSEAAVFLAQQVRKKQLAAQMPVIALAPGKDRALGMPTIVQVVDEVPQSPMPKSPSPIPEEECWEDESLER
jgi:hypothetical protein